MPLARIVANRARPLPGFPPTPCRHYCVGGSRDASLEPADSCRGGQQVDREDRTCKDTPVPRAPDKTRPGTALPAKTPIPVRAPDPHSYLTAQVSVSAVRHNLRTVRGHLRAGVRLCAVVKADAYGHGLRGLLPLLADEADMLAVATPAEALDLRGLGYAGPLLVFFSTCAYRDGARRRDVLAELIARDVTLTVAAVSEVSVVARAAAAAGRPATVHAKIDTGMSRSGTLWTEAASLAAALADAPVVRLAGLYTHFATADEGDKAFTRVQLGRFRQAVAAFGSPAGLCRHAANSAALADLPETHLDMVRPGIALYGYQASDALHTRLPLRPSLRLCARLMQVKTVPAGSGCGYGLTHRCQRDTRLGLVPVGYGDGYPRCLSNRASVRVGGRDAPIRGRVAMDQIIVDLADAPQARVGDEVEVISPDPAAPHSVAALAGLADTIPYEITCRLSGPRVRRVFVA